MNINVISNQVMLAHSHVWTQDPTIVYELTKHPLGAAILAEVKRVHQYLSDTQDRRAEIRKALRRLSELLAALNARHDGLSRAIYALLRSFVHATRSPDDARPYSDLLDMLFPHGMQLVRLTYLGKAGAMIERMRRVTEPMLALMANIKLGDSSLLDLYKEWNTVAEEIGARAQEQARLRVSLTSEGTAITAKNTMAARHEWIAVVSAMMINLSFIPLSDTAREMLLGPLTQSIHDALSRRAAGKAEDVDGDGDIDEDDLSGEDSGDGGGDIIDNEDSGNNDDVNVPDDDLGSAGDSAAIPATA